MNRPYATHPHRQLVPPRITELMDNLKTEYEQLTRNANVYKLERDEFERKLQQQIQESQSIQTQIYELERNYQKLKQKYEDEIIHLRRQLGQPVTEIAPSLTPSRTPITGEKRTLSSVEVGAQDLGSLAKRHSRELPAPLVGGSSPVGNQYNGLSGSISLSQIAKQASTSKRVSAESAGKSQTNGQQPKKKRRPSPEPDGEGNDWVVGYNPGVSRKLDVKLDHDMEHDSVVCCVNFSTDGKYLATGCNHSAQIFDVKTSNKVHTFREKPDSEADLYIRSVCFSPDGKYLATGAEDKTVKLWDIEKETIRHNLIGHDLDIYSLVFTPDGRHVISGSGDKKVKIWRVEDAKCVWTLGDDSVGPKDGVTSVAVSPDGRTVASGSLDRIVRLWDTESGVFIGQYEGHKDSVYSVAFAPDGKTLASGSLDKTLKLWDIGRQHRPRCKITLTGHRDFVLSVAFSPDGNWLVSGSKDRSVQFWDPKTSITHMILQGHRNSVISVALTGEKDGSAGKFATGSGDCKARIWHYRTGIFNSQNA